MSDINSTKAFIFRIVHIQNVAWICAAHGGIASRNSAAHDPNYVNIGLASLIEKRSAKVVPIPPGGTLRDYVPFYFTPYSPMLYTILNGYGVPKKTKNEIVIFVSTIPKLRELNLPFVYTNQHAYTAEAEFFGPTGDLSQIDWTLLRSRNFSKSDDDPGKSARYQAEALVYKSVPLAAIVGLGCANTAVQAHLTELIRNAGHNLPVKSVPNWYF